MSEQPRPPNPPEKAAAPPGPDAFDDIVLDGPADVSDDTPTIISKIQPRPSPPENLLGGILRGRQLAHFELIEPIGVGGMAAVLRARDTQLERIVALKILPPEMAADPENVARFHQEARAAARLDHETIARVFFCGEDQDLHFIAFEFVEGENLRTLIERRGPLPVPEALHYMLQVATGLAHAAGRGVVHRDIKPSNIIISPNGRAKLVDMGLARNLGPHTDGGLTHSGVTLGTFDYISPEQALEPRDADARSDIYSLGCTFYHVLTGRAPVPEGTAARKLNHHQHVPPIDPRQLNPDIPDEVAAILGRMMAKDPRQRYQRPEHLVQHLLQVTRRLGAGVEAPDGVLFVDAPLPAPPRTRPLLVAGCAAAIVVVLVFLIGPSQNRISDLGFQISDVPGAPNPQPGVVNRKSDVPQTNSPPVDNAEGAAHLKSEIPNLKSEGPVRLELTRDNAARVARTMLPEKSYDLVLKGDLRLGAEDGTDEVAGLVLRGKSITLTGDGPGRPTVWSRFVAAPGKVGGLVIEAETVRLRNLRVVADAGNNAPAQAAAGVFCRNSREVTASDCEFLQGNLLPSSSLFSSVAVQSGEAAPRPSVTFERCGFLGGKGVKHPDAAAMGGDNWLSRVEEGGQTAVAVLGAASVRAKDCAFGPHACLFRFGKGEGKGGGGTSGLSVDQCTALAGDDWALACLGEDTSATVTARACLFGRVGTAPEAGMTMMAERKTACLVRLAASAELTRYQGTSDRYLNLDALLLRGGDDANVGPDLFATQLAERLDTDRNDEKVLPPDARPWKDKAPLALLQAPLRPEDLRTAFGLDAAAVPELRLRSQEVVGVRDSPWGPLGERPTASTVKVVDPAKGTDSARGVYQTLGAALAELKPDDVIAIRYNGELPVNPVRLPGGGGTVTIKAEGDSHPILVLDKRTSDPRAALFRVPGGQLNLEGLEFRLHPGPAGFESQAVALLLGEGGVQFTRCVVTLDGQQAPLAAVALADARDAMMPAAGAGGPKVVFDTCFVRGDGDLVAARASRPFELEVKDSLVALTGSLLSVDAGTKEAPPAAAGQRIPVRLERVTAYLGGHLARLRAADLRSLVPVSFDPPARSCLLVAAGEHSRALVHLEAGPKDDRAARDRLVWNGQDNNYANFAPMLDQQPGETDVSLPMVSEKEWKGTDGESKFEAVKFAGPLWTDEGAGVSAAEVSPRAFVVKSGPKGVGVQKPLPLPAGER